MLKQHGGEGGAVRKQSKYAHQFQHELQPAMRVHNHKCTAWKLNSRERRDDWKKVEDVEDLDGL